MLQRFFVHLPLVTKAAFVSCLIWTFVISLGFDGRKSDQLSPKVHSARAEAPSCGFDGNPDIYGLGIRIGIYAQTIAAWIGSELARFDVSELNLTTNLFMSSLLISLVWVSSKRSLHVIEAFLMLQMLFCSWFTGTGMRSRPVLLSPRRGIEGEALNRLLKFFMVVYNAWFWWREIDLLASTPCGTYIFFIAFKFNLYGSIRLAHKVLSIVAIAVEFRRAIVYSSGIFIRLQAQLLYSDDAHNLIEKQALRNLAILETYDTDTRPYMELKETSNTPGCYIKTRSSIQRRWSSGSLNQHSASSLKDSEAQGPSPAFHDRAKEVLPKHVDILRILEADVFLEDVMKSMSNTCQSLVRRGFKIGDSEVDQVSFVGLNKAYWCCFCEVLSLVVRRPKYIRALIIIVFAYETEAQEVRTHDTCFIILAALQNAQFLKVDWQHLHLAAQLRATRATYKRLPAYVWWSVAIGFFFCIIQILAVELTIVWNHISGVHDLLSVGQLIPFVVGCGSLFRMLYVEGKRSWRRRSLSTHTVTQDEVTVVTWVRAYFDWRERHSRLGWRGQRCLPQSLSGRIS